MTQCYRSQQGGHPPALHDCFTESECAFQELEIHVWCFSRFFAHRVIEVVCRSRCAACRCRLRVTVHSGSRALIQLWLRSRMKSSVRFLFSVRLGERMNLRYMAHTKFSYGERTERKDEKGVTTPLPWSPSELMYLHRLANMHCHVSGVSGIPTEFYPMATTIKSRETKQAICPDWLPPGTSLPAKPIDVSQLVPFPESLERALDSATTLLPHKQFLADQLVRVLVENRNLKAALHAANRCTVDRAWCGLLTAYVTASMGDAIGADSLFRIAVAELPIDRQCNWNSVLKLIPSNEASRFSVKSCAPSEEFSRNMWWLATPFLSEGINARRSEHYARLVRSALESELPFSAQHDLRFEKGGDAAAALHERYGWPIHAVYAGEKEELKAHGIGFMGREDAPPYPAPEYDIARAVAALPSTTAGLEPYSVSDFDFHLMAPTDSSRFHWWPSEHFVNPNGAILQLHQYQRVFSSPCRRDRNSFSQQISKTTCQKPLATHQFTLRS